MTQIVVYFLFFWRSWQHYYDMIKIIIIDHVPPKTLRVSQKVSPLNLKHGQRKTESQPKSSTFWIGHFSLLLSCSTWRRWPASQLTRWIPAHGKGVRNLKKFLVPASSCAYLYNFQCNPGPHCSFAKPTWVSPLNVAAALAIFCPGRSQISSGSVNPVLPRGPACWAVNS